MVGMKKRAKDKNMMMMRGGGMSKKPMMRGGGMTKKKMMRGGMAKKKK